MNIFEQRIKCWNETLEISNMIPLPPPSIKVKYQNDFTFHKKYPRSNIKFFDIDSIDCALLESPNALILNLADDNFPGGCVQMGSGAQEESLFRRTNYCKSLKIEMYPIKNDEVIISPNISVIKTDEKSGWKFFNKNNLPKVSFVACPGIKYPETIVVNDEKRLNETDAETLKNKIKTIVQSAIKYNYDTIIFGALGCGAWKNPVKHVAEIFKEVLELYDGAILNYYFAIMTTDANNYIVRNHDNGNGMKTIDIFRRIFNNL